MFNLQLPTRSSLRPIQLWMPSIVQLFLLQQVFAARAFLLAACAQTSPLVTRTFRSRTGFGKYEVSVLRPRGFCIPQ
ncbi:hypothetical protein AHF37_08427 [Paragonimus kellicotti]|nr:hypothetical protein AHF37_08427 [Paragonimus kellicotti]